MSALGSDCSLFTQLYIACQVTNSDGAKSFSHGRQACPLSFSLDGKLRKGRKADITSCLEKVVPPKPDTSQMIICTGVVFIDGAAVVDMLNPELHIKQHNVLRTICPS